MKKLSKASLKLFKQSHIYCIPNIISAREADSFRIAMLNNPKYSSKIQRGPTSFHDPLYRQSQTVPVRKIFRNKAVEIFQSLRPNFEEYFGQRLGACQSPQFLLYRRGNFFRRHSDNFNSIKPSKDRLITVILFLSSFSEAQSLSNNPINNRYYFSGGKLLIDDNQTLEKELSVAEKKSEILGKTGLVVAFMAGTKHEVTPIKSGFRFTIVTWFETP